MGELTLKDAWKDLQDQIKAVWGNVPSEILDEMTLVDQFINPENTKVIGDIPIPEGKEVPGPEAA